MRLHHLLQFLFGLGLSRRFGQALQLQSSRQFISKQVACNFFNRRFSTTRSANSQFRMVLKAADDEKLESKLRFKLPIESDESSAWLKWLVPGGALAALAAGMMVQRNVNFADIFNEAVSYIAGLGPIGYLYFAVVYILAELLAIPAMPLTASSGYLFGLVPGTLLVIISATIAASISFVVGRTYLRSWAQEFIQSSDMWRAVDKAIAKEGFKVVLLLRLSPLLPFALSNYLYAVTSVDFTSFITATFLGFSPGTFGIVYFGSAGKEFIESGGTSFGLPWYGYAAAAAFVLLFIQTMTKIASDAIKEMDERESDI